MADKYEQGVRRPSTTDLVMENAAQLYRKTIGHPLASGKGRHEYAAKLRPDGGSPDALRDGGYGPKAIAKDLMSAAKDTRYNIRNVGAAETAGPASMPPNNGEQGLRRRMMPAFSRMGRALK